MVDADDLENELERTPATDVDVDRGPRSGTRPTSGPPPWVRLRSVPIGAIDEIAERDVDFFGERRVIVQRLWRRSTARRLVVSPDLGANLVQLGRELTKLRTNTSQCVACRRVGDGVEAGEALELLRHPTGVLGKHLGRAFAKSGLRQLGEVRNTRAVVLLIHWHPGWLGSTDRRFGGSPAGTIPQWPLDRECLGSEPAM